MAQGSVSSKGNAGLRVTLLIQQATADHCARRQSMQSVGRLVGLNGFISFAIVMRNVTQEPGASHRDEQCKETNDEAK